MICPNCGGELSPVMIADSNIELGGRIVTIEAEILQCYDCERFITTPETERQIREAVIKLMENK